MGSIPLLFEKTITAILYDEIVQVPSLDSESILSSMLSAGLNPPYSCKIGACGACTAKLISGKVQMVETSSLSAIQLSNNYILACQAKLCSETCEIIFE